MAFCLLDCIVTTIACSTNHSPTPLVSSSSFPEDSVLFVPLYPENSASLSFVSAYKKTWLMYLNHPYDHISHRLASISFLTCLSDATSVLFHFYGVLVNRQTS
jgi:hypothetical protein